MKMSNWHPLPVEVKSSLNPGLATLLWALLMSNLARFLGAVEAVAEAAVEAATTAEEAAKNNIAY